MDDIVAVVTDLIFQSRVSSAAKHGNRSVRYLLSQESVAGVNAYNLALVDLEARLDVLAAIKSLKARGGGPVIAFGPHVDIERLKAARAAGADRVLARSKFVTELPSLMLSVSPNVASATPE